MGSVACAKGFQNPFSILLGAATQLTEHDFLLHPFCAIQRLRFFPPHAGEGGLDLLPEAGDQFAIGGLGMKSFSRKGAETQRKRGVGLF